MSPVDLMPPPPPLSGHSSRLSNVIIKASFLLVYRRRGRRFFLELFLCFVEPLYNILEESQGFLEILQDASTNFKDSERFLAVRISNDYVLILAKSLKDSSKIPLHFLKILYFRWYILDCLTRESLRISKNLFSAKNERKILERFL